MFSIKGYKPQKTNEILNKIEVVNSLEDSWNIIRNEWHSNKGVSVISFVNAHAMNILHKDEEFYTAIKQSDVILRDGIGLKMLMQSLHMSPGFNANGTDLIPYILNKFSLKNQVSVAIYATTAERVAIASKKLTAQGINVSIYEHGFHDEHYYVSQVTQKLPDIIILGMGMPKQEKLAIKIKQNLSEKILILNGGAIIDFISDSVPRAPALFRNLGLEWLYRLLTEPKRLWKRYIVGNACFMLALFVHKFINSFSKYMK